MSKIDELITAAKKAVEDTETGTDARARAEYRLELLEEMKDEHKVTLSQDEVNGVVRKETDKAKDAADSTASEWSELLGMELDEAKTVMSEFDPETLESLAASGDGDGGDGDGDNASPPSGNGEQAPVLKSLQAAVENLRAENKEICDQNAEFQRTILSDRISSGLTKALKAGGLQDAFLEPARRLSGFDDLVKAAMDGNEPDEARFKEIAASVKSESQPWFEEPRNDDWPGIEFTPVPGEPPRLTDEQRADASASVF